MNQIVDSRIQVFAGSGEGTPALLPDVLVEYMDGPFTVAGERRHVDRAVIAPHRPPANNGRPSSPGKLHAPLVDACQRYPDRLYGSFSYQPTDGPECALPELERL